MLVRFEVLGPLRVFDGELDVTPRGRLQRLLLALLLVRANQPVADDTLTEAMWPGDTDARTPARLQLQVHRLRLVLDDPDRLTREPAGYRLRVDPAESDLARFDELAARLLATDEDPAMVSQRSREALDLWRGDPLANIDELSLQPELQRWTDRRLMAVESLCDAELALGNFATVLSDVEQIASQHPLNERFQALLMRGLYAAGRPADALEVYARSFESLRDELGLEPGSVMRDLQARILDGDPIEEGATSLPTPAQLPAGTAHLVGRDRDLADLDKLWQASETSGVWVVTGTAGVGKTAFAVQWAHRHREDFPDGQLFFDLRGFSADEPARPGDVLAAFLRSLGFDTGGLTEDETERSALFRSLVDGRRLLIVLDNARSADQVRPLLPAATGCCVLVTSRETLTGLAVREGAQVLELPPLDDQDSLDLLARLTDDRVHNEPEAAAHLVRKCARLPLALRIAAEQVRARPGRTVADLVAELSEEHDRLDLMDAGDGPATDVRAVFSWSYESLPDEAARLFRHFGMLPGKDADAHALAALCGQELAAVRRSLSILLRAHLIDESPGGQYCQHDLLRAYAGEGARLLETDESRRAATSRLLGYYSQAAFLADDLIRPGETFDKATVAPPVADVSRFADPAMAMDWLEWELANVMAALAETEEDDAHRVMELSQSFADFLRNHGRDVQGIWLHERALAAARQLRDPHGEAHAEIALGVVRSRSGDLDDGQQHFHRALAIHTEITGNRVGQAAAEANLGVRAYVRGNLEEAARRVTAARTVYAEHGERRRTALQDMNLGVIYRALGEPARASECLERALVITGADDLPSEHCTALGNLAFQLFTTGDLAGAFDLAVDAEAGARRLQDPELEASALLTQASVCLARGEARESQARALTALQRSRVSGHVISVAECLQAIARAVSAEDPAGGVPYFREAAAFAKDHGMRRIEADLRIELADACEASGDTAVAQRELAWAQSLFEDLDDPQAEAISLRLASAGA